MSILEQIVQTVGPQAAGHIIETFGGTRIYVPVMASAASPIAQSVGLDTAAKLSRVFGGEQLDIPNPRSSRERILALRRQGSSIHAISREVGCTRRWVYKVLEDGSNGLCANPRIRLSPVK